MLKIRDLSFSYGQKKVLEHFSLSVDPGEIVALMGPSGCGKSTLLNLIAGFQKPNSGSLECSAKRISYVFQEPRLFPWLTVEENLFAVLPSHDATARERVEKALSAVSLSDANSLYPSELSGGMRSRASLARALAYGGDLFLLDEPFSALDEALRTSLATALRTEFQKHGVTALLVTHSPAEAAAMADRTIALPQSDNTEAI